MSESVTGIPGIVGLRHKKVSFNFMEPGNDEYDK